MKNIKTPTVILFALVIFFSSLTVKSVSAGQIYLNNKPLGVEVETKIINDRTMVPLRIVAEMFGCRVDWNSATKGVSVYAPLSDKLMTELVIGSETAVIYPIDENGNSMPAKKVTLDAAPVIIDSSTYLPLRFIVENMGYTVEYDEKTGDIYIMN